MEVWYLSSFWWLFYFLSKVSSSNLCRSVVYSLKLIADVCDNTCKPIVEVAQILDLRKCVSAEGLKTSVYLKVIFMNVSKKTIVNQVNLPQGYSLLLEICIDCFWFSSLLAISCILFFIQLSLSLSI